MQTLIAFMRNGGCVVKDALDGRKHWLNEPLVGPVTVIETWIAPLQLAAVLYNFTAAVPHLTSYAGAWFTSTELSEEQWATALALAASNGASSPACQIVKTSLAEHFVSTRTKDAAMVCKLAIGTAFVLLTLLTLHVPYPCSIQWMLLALEFALAFLLTVMAAGVAKGWRRAADLRRLSDALASGAAPSGPSATPLLLEPMSLLPLPAAPWTSALPVADAFGVASVAAYVAAVATTDAQVIESLKRMSAAEKASVAATLSAQSSAQWQQVLLSVAELLFNAVAFFGYAVFPLTFFVAEAPLVRALPVWPGHGTATFWGNLAGDFAWTVEAAVMLVVPAMLERVASSRLAQAKKRA